jgi:hypothetical protein
VGVVGFGLVEWHGSTDPADCGHVSRSQLEPERRSRIRR